MKPILIKYLLFLCRIYFFIYAILICGVNPVMGQYMPFTAVQKTYTQLQPIAGSTTNVVSFQHGDLLSIQNALGQYISFSKRQISFSLGIYDASGTTAQPGVYPAGTNSWDATVILKVYNVNPTNPLNAYPYDRIILQINESKPFIRQMLACTANGSSGLTGAAMVRVESVNVTSAGGSGIVSLIQNQLKLTIAPADEVSYEPSGMSGGASTPFMLTDLGVRAVFFDALTPATQKVSAATFRWKPQHTTGNATYGKPYVPLYELQVLKLEASEVPSAGNVSITVGNPGFEPDWQRAATIEVPGDHDLLSDGSVTYTMTLAQGSGVYTWRVRPVGNKYTGGRGNIANISNTWFTGSNLPAHVVPFSPFSAGSVAILPDYCSVSGALHTLATANIANSIYANLPTGSTFQSVGSFVYCQFDDDRNWMYQRTFTDEGGQAEAITYANGLGFSYQTQAKRFADQKVIATQTAYDYTGRPALQSVPIPSSQQWLTYNPEILYEDNSGVKNIYDASHFDTDGTTNTLYNPATPEGQAYAYYNGGATGPGADRVARVGNYPFTLQEYENNPTGRIRKAGGIGDELRLKAGGDDNHNVTVVYSAVSQEELDIVFGAEAPFAASVRKQITEDPNGVKSVAYIAKDGKTLATAIAAPVVLDNITSGGRIDMELETSVTAFGGANTQTVTHTLAEGVLSADQTSKMSFLKVYIPKVNASTNPILTLDYSISPSEFNLKGCANGLGGYQAFCDITIEILVTNLDKPADANSNFIIRGIIPGEMLAAGATGPATHTAAFTSFSDLLLAIQSMPAGSLASLKYQSLNAPLSTYNNLITNQFTVEPGNYRIVKRIYSGTTPPAIPGVQTADHLKPTDEAITETIDAYYADYLDDLVALITDPAFDMDQACSTLQTAVANCDLDLSDCVVEPCETTGCAADINDMVTAITDTLIKYLEFEHGIGTTNPSLPGLYYTMPTPDPASIVGSPVNCMDYGPQMWANTSIAPRAAALGFVSSGGTINASTITCWVRNVLGASTTGCTGLPVSPNLPCDKVNQCLEGVKNRLALNIYTYKTGGLKLSLYDDQNNTSNYYDDEMDFIGILETCLGVAPVTQGCLGTGQIGLVAGNSFSGIFWPTKIDTDEKTFKFHRCAGMYYKNYDQAMQELLLVGSGTRVLTIADGYTAADVDLKMCECMKAVDVTNLVFSASNGVGLPSTISPSTQISIYTNQFNSTNQSFTTMLTKCTQECTNNAAAYGEYENAIDQYVVNYNQEVALNAPTPPASPYTFNDLFVTTGKYASKSCVVNTLTATCLQACTTHVENMRYCSLNKLRSSISDLLSTAGISIPAGIMTVPNPPSPLPDCASDADALGYAQIMNGVVKFAPPAAQYPNLPAGFTQPTPYPAINFLNLGGGNNPYFTGSLGKDLADALNRIGDQALKQFKSISNDYVYRLYTNSLSSTVWPTPSGGSLPAGVIQIQNTTQLGQYSSFFTAVPATGKLLVSVAFERFPFAFVPNQGGDPITDAVKYDFEVHCWVIAHAVVNPANPAESGLVLESIHFRLNCPTELPGGYYQDLDMRTLSCGPRPLNFGFPSGMVEYVRFTDDQKPFGITAHAGSRLCLRTAVGGLSAHHLPVLPKADAAGNLLGHPGNSNGPLPHAAFRISGTHFVKYKTFLKLFLSNGYDTWPLVSSSVLISGSPAPATLMATIATQINLQTTSPDFVAEYNAALDEVRVYPTSYFGFSGEYNLDIFPTYAGSTLNWTEIRTINLETSWFIDELITASSLPCGPQAASLATTIPCPQGYSLIQNANCPVCVKYVSNSTSSLAPPTDPAEPEPTCADTRLSVLNNYLTQKLGQARLNALEANANAGKKCLENTQESLTISYEVSYKHYTLYYYDRAGNLIRTVPPEGVTFLNTTQMADVKAWRTAGAAPGQITATMLPGHAMTTTYGYNSLAQQVNRTTPDGGYSRVWYNAKGLPALSQDARQLATSRYSYVCYDPLGRTTESGELQLSATSPALTFNGQKVEEIWDKLDFPARSSYSRYNITQTEYSKGNSSVTYFNYPQTHLRNRVSCVRVYDKAPSQVYFTDKPGAAVDPITDVPIQQTYYSYDPHGNVKWMVHDYAQLWRKSVGYTYDLVTGKVKEVWLNKGETDQFGHRYRYDEDNRLTEVYTSADGYVWDRDAQYEFFDHGPLARLEIGQDHVQGIDYTYTAQGWLKALNAVPGATGVADPGNDAGSTLSTTAINPVISTLRDEWCMNLHYFNGDYTSTLTLGGNPLGPSPYGLNITATSLYNGNIAAWSQYTRRSEEISSIDPGPRIHTYQYDILNRLRESKTQHFTLTAGGYTTAASKANHFKETFTYDANGNIQTLARYKGEVAGSPTLIDNLTYHYNNAPGTTRPGNQLAYVDDIQPNSVLSGDFDDQRTKNYRYDPSGNLTRDAQAQMNLVWNASGKLARVEKLQDTLLNIPSSVTQYFYDAGGNRTSKQAWVYTQGSWALQSEEIYVRDVQGNVLAVYEGQNQPASTGLVYSQAEVGLYGSGRLGLYRPGAVVQRAAPGTGNPWDPGTASVAEWQSAGAAFEALGGRMDILDELKRIDQISDPEAYGELNTTWEEVQGSFREIIGTFEDNFGVYKGIDPEMRANFISSLANMEAQIGARETAEEVASKWPAWLEAYGSRAGYLTQSELEVLQGLIATGESRPRKLIISGLMYDSPLTIDGQAEAHAGEAIAIRNVSAEQVRLDDYHLMDPATGDSLHFPAVYLQPGKVLVVARPGAGSAGTVAGLEALAGIDPQVWAGEYTLWQAAGLPVLADGGGSLALVYTAEGGMQLEDEVEWGPGGLLAANGYNTAQPLALNRQVYQLGVESSSTYSGFDAAEWATTASVINPGPPPVLQAAVGERRLGGKRYELTDHLGNVRAVISDIRSASISGNVVSFATDVKSFTDYYAFGWAMPGRNYSAGEYRYGFNTQEMSPEIGLGHTTALFWEYDAQLGRRWNVDPKPVSGLSLYSTFSNNPIFYSDVLGDSLKGYDKTSATRMRDEIQNSFKGEDAAQLRSLFTLKNNGLTMKEISVSAFSEATKSLSEEQQLLAKGYFIAINSKFLHQVEMIYRNEKISPLGLALTDCKTTEGFNNLSSGGIAKPMIGGFANHYIIIMDPNINVRDTRYPNDGGYSPQPSEVGELMAHEILGHGLGIEFHSLNLQHQDAIQMGNLYLAAKYGRSNARYRDGSSHIINGFLSTAKGVPSFINKGFDELVEEDRIKRMPFCPTTICVPDATFFKTGN